MASTSVQEKFVFQNLNAQQWFTFASSAVAALACLLNINAVQRFVRDVFIGQFEGHSRRVWRDVVHQDQKYYYAVEQLYRFW